MKANKNCIGVKRQISIFLLVFMVIMGFKYGFGQERFLMDENTFQKFKLSKRMFEKGKAYFLKEKYNKAKKSLKECLEDFPRYSQADYFLSQIFYKEGDFPKALVHIEKAKANYGFMADLLVATQQKYLDDLRTQKQELQANLIDLTSGSDIDQVKALIKNIDTKLNEPIPVVPKKSADYYYFHGNIFMKLKKYNEAQAQYIEALQIDPNHGNASNNLASLYYMIKQYQKALDYLTQAETNGVKINQEFKKAILKALKKE